MKILELVKLLYKIVNKVRLAHWQFRGISNLVIHELTKDIYYSLDKYLDELVEISQVEIKELPDVDIPGGITINGVLSELLKLNDVISDKANIPKELDDWKGRLVSDIQVWQFKIKPKTYIMS